MVVQPLTGEVAARCRHGRGASHETVHQESALLRQVIKLTEDVFAACDHLIGVVGGDVGGEEHAAAGLSHCPLERLDHHGDDLPHRAEGLVALRLIVLEEVATEPELVGGLSELLGPQSELGLDDGADDEAAVPVGLARGGVVGDGLAAHDLPHVTDVHRGAVEQTHEVRGEPDVHDLAVLDVTHTLVVADDESEDGAEHRPSVSDVAVEELDGVGDLHELVLLIQLVRDGVDRDGVVVGRADVDVGAGGRLGSKVGGGTDEVLGDGVLGSHVVCDEDVLLIPHEGLLVQVQLDVAVGLIQSHPHASRALTAHTDALFVAARDEPGAGKVTADLAGQGGAPDESSHAGRVVAVRHDEDCQHGKAFDLDRSEPHREKTPPSHRSKSDLAVVCRCG
mmetsp:Transcript_27232/g.67919  ORF Transcript_27232/g.67919 Transcript_27232/m.67919 type:complete len:394 (+) Transcript_27232:835-2016(+)